MGFGICRPWERNWSVFLGSQCSHSDFVTGRHGLWAWKSGSIVLAVTRPGCVHICGAAPGVSSPQASEVGMPFGQGTQCEVVSSHSRSGHILYSCVVHVRVWVLQKVGLCMVSSQKKKKALYVGKASVCRTHSPGLAARLTEHFRCLYRPGLKDANKPRIDFSGASYGVYVSFFLTVFPTISQTLAAEALAISMEAPMGNARDAAEERRFRRKRRPWESIWGCSVTQEALANRSQGKPVQFPGALGLDIPFSLCTAQIREQHAYYGFSRSFFFWRIVRKVRIDRTSSGSGYRGGLVGKLHHICMVRANMFPSFSSFPPDSVLPPEFWFSVFVPYLPKEFQFFRCLRLSRILGMSSESSTMLLVACAVGQRAGGFRRSWQFGGCGTSVARGPFETFDPRISGTGRLSN